jgi:hypothetical protein
LKKNYFSSHKLPKQQSTNFWSQGILGVNNANPSFYAKHVENSYFPLPSKFKMISMFEIRIQVVRNKGTGSKAENNCYTMMFKNPKLLDVTILKNTIFVKTLH